MAPADAPPNFRRWILIGVAFLAWNIALVTAATMLSAGTQGENVGKFVGTIASAFAFVPPAWFIWRRYQRSAEQDRADRIAARAATDGAPSGNGSDGTTRLDG